jgi:hypothetical protein
VVPSASASDDITKASPTPLVILESDGSVRLGSHARANLEPLREFLKQFSVRGAAIFLLYL